MLLLALCTYKGVFAAEITFEKPSGVYGSGDEFSLPITLNSPDELVNAVEGELFFSDDTVTISRIETANSIISNWVETPYVSGNAIVFSGIIPGGFKSVTDPITQNKLPGTLFTLIVQIQKKGTVSLTMSDIHVYKNDGLGTEALVNVSPFSMDVSTIGTHALIAQHDTNPPEPFTPLVTNNLELASGAYVVIFSTTDKESGIDHYEVREGLGSWNLATSPYVLTDQTLRSVVRVKAVDLAGNYRIGIVGKVSQFPVSVFLIPGLILLLVLFILYRVYTVYVKRSK